MRVRIKLGSRGRGQGSLDKVGLYKSVQQAGLELFCGPCSLLYYIIGCNLERVGNSLYLIEGEKEKGRGWLI